MVELFFVSIKEIPLPVAVSLTLHPKQAGLLKGGDRSAHTVVGAGKYKLIGQAGKL